MFWVYADHGWNGLVPVQMFDTEQGALAFISADQGPYELIIITKAPAP